MKKTILKIWKNDEIYPPLLLQISDAPKRLYYLGQKLNPPDKYFAIVGTRRPSIYGKQMAEDFSTALAQKGFVIVSGLAYGIDAIAHRAALNANGKTIAVLGAGFNHITPTCNLGLAEEIVKNGTILTEYEAEVAPQKFTFPERNRIIAGMSIATLVIEAPEKSGALITARLALEYNRDVFALPGNITQETSKGANALIRDCKAFPATCVQDIFDYMQLGFSGKEQEENSPLSALSEEEKTIYQLLKQSPMTTDNMVIQTEMPASRVNILLSMLELKGLIEVRGSYAFITR